MNDVMTTVNNMIWNLTHRVGLTDIIDIVIMAAIFYEILILIRRTRSSALLKGVFLLLLMSLVSSLLGLTSLNWLLTNILNNGAVVLLVLFQPEIRKALERMGRTSLMNRKDGQTLASDGSERIINEILQTASDLSRRKVGALIVFERRTGLQDVIDTGTLVDGEISAPLLENIFEPNTPLHDGAVVIRQGRIVSAACILPLTEASGVSRELGISEASDAIVLVVSEETGTISIAQGGQIRRPITRETLRSILEDMFAQQESPLMSFFHGLLRSRKEAKV